MNAETTTASTATGIAVSGIDCRFPGAPDKETFWALLLDGADGVGPLPAQRWDRDAFYAEHPTPGRTNTRDGGFITDPDAFDNEFFGITPREAAAMDPQQRILLQCSWRALEDAGIDPTRLEQTRTGVFVGIMGNEWAHLQLRDYERITPHVGAGNGYCMTANRVSYHLNLRGPSVAVDTACSSSLVAVHQACLALRSGECDRALAAGVNMILTPALHVFYAQAGLSAPDGRCKPFSAHSDGIGRGEGVGVVVLRRLEDAVADGDPIYAVIRGSAVNHDGRSNGITAPNRWAQGDVMARACARAGVAPPDITFVEAHGTGTLLGDMIEVRALGQLHGERRDQPCLIGSVKGNIGHAEGAAGIAGLIKVALALHHRIVPPSRYAEKENAQLRLAQHGLRLSKEAAGLPDGDVLAAISSFGLGGTNAHVVVAAWDALYPDYPDGDPPTIRLQPYVFSTRNRFWPTGGGPAPRAVETPPAANEPVSGSGPLAAGQTDDQTYEQVVEAVVAVCGHAADRVRPGTRLHEDLGFDSVMIIELVNHLERRIPAAAPIDVAALLPHIATVDDLARFLSGPSPTHPPDSPLPPSPPVGR